jgi:hypothetical protein
MCCMFIFLSNSSVYESSYLKPLSPKRLLVCSLLLFLVNALCHKTSSVFLWFMHLVVHLTATSVQLLTLELSHLLRNSFASLNTSGKVCVLVVCAIIKRHRGVAVTRGTWFSVYKYRYTCLCYFCSNYNAYLMILTARRAQLIQWLTVVSTVRDLNPAGSKFSGHIQTGSEIHLAFCAMDQSIYIWRHRTFWAVAPLNSAPPSSLIPRYLWGFPT